MIRFFKNQFYKLNNKNNNNNNNNNNQSNIFQFSNCSTIIDLNNINNSNIVFCTSTDATNDLIRNLDIKWVIVDNSHQEVEPKTLCALNLADHVILFGDSVSDISVGPISVKSKKFRNLMKINLSKRLSNYIRPFTLTSNYIPSIFSNLLSLDKINFQDLSFFNFYKEKPIFSFFNLESIESLEIMDNENLDDKEMIQKFTNIKECEFVCKLVRFLLKTLKLDPLEIVIVSPFEAQRNLIKKNILDLPFINVLPIEMAQYYHFSYLIVSLVRTKGDNSKSYWCESDQRTIKKLVLIPRIGLFFIGYANYFQKRERWSLLINHTKSLDSLTNILDSNISLFNFYQHELKTHNTIKIE
ncbi:hypothetical protein DDB_G0275427 [Dictyostelium discoideum AX4]|uniref:DNA2/NAM7 helicase-like C-terminal domain-containing protein n=1 Tax=Dictyostelium discoideum TaxID=44689 RepID=Q553Q0_DICDI|nr:hypothetical protein DDB_G0275427 [Dictyostelium discoideum AX4]EAL69779.1 hypothetical protein DDB_G0275427 [Dictyostelium discoideum AX4]|eukprot:XP_643696.1 hypothetical protein DDB_G0275427 [Dictyostelium discoideum AX4]